MDGSAAETVELLARRANLLRTLREGPREKRDLVAEHSVSRSTIDRAVRNLAAQNLVTRDDRISLTLKGHLAIDAYDEFAEDVESLADAEPVLESLSPDATIDRSLLAGATVLQSNRVTPQRPANDFLSVIEDAIELRAFGTALLPSYLEFIHDRVVDGSLHVDLVLTADVLDELLAGHGDTVQEALDTGDLVLREAGETLEYSLGIAELPERTVVSAIVYDDHGRNGVVYNDAPEAVRWAEQVYERLRADAEPLSSA